MKQKHQKVSIYLRLLNLISLIKKMLPELITSISILISLSIVDFLSKKYFHLDNFDYSFIVIFIIYEIISRYKRFLKRKEQRFPYFVNLNSGVKRIIILAKDEEEAKDYFYDHYRTLNSDNNIDIISIEKGRFYV